MPTPRPEQPGPSTVVVSHMESEALGRGPVACMLMGDLETRSTVPASDPELC